MIKSRSETKWSCVVSNILLLAICKVDHLFIVYFFPIENLNLGSWHIVDHFFSIHFQIENLNLCLRLLAGLGVNVEGIHAKDLREGNLKAILGLFFALSRYKQEQKALAQQQQQNQQQHQQQQQQQPQQQAQPQRTG